MRTVTFYSYKGGTGRTLLLANIAILAARMGRKVVAIDVDLEAPGLAYKLLDDPLTRCDGLVGWLRDRFASGEAPASLGDSLIDVPVEDPFLEGGWLKLMPAGRNPSMNYFQDLTSLQLERRINDGEGVDAFLDLKDQIEPDLAPDFLLLDARTGISSTNLVTTRVLADDVIALTLDSREQLDGTRSVLRSLTPLTSLRTGESMRLHVVLSRVEGRPADIASYALTENENEQVRRVRTFLQEPADPLRATLRVERLHLLHSEHLLARREFLTLARTRVLDATALHVDCIRIAEAVLSEDVSTIAARVISTSVDPQERLIRAQFFARSKDIMDASGDVIERRLAAGDKALPRPESSERKSPVRVRPEARMGRSAAEELREAEVSARAFGSLAAYFIEAGRYRDAGNPSEKAVDIYGRLATSNPAFRANLAEALKNLGISHRHVGLPAEARAATERAADIYQDLVRSNPSLRLDFAAALGTLAELLSDAGDHSEALKASQRAVALYRSIAEQRPSTGFPLLAASLRELANQLDAAGQQSRARAAASESERVYAALLEEK